MDVDGLAVEWEGVKALRTRLRDHRKLHLHPQTQKWCEPTRLNCNSNAMILLPALNRLQFTNGWKLPYIDPLQDEIALLYQKVGIPPEEKEIYKAANEMKKMLSFVKRRAQRKEVTKDPLFQVGVFSNSFKIYKW